MLTGVHLGSFGHDLGDRAGLTRLVKALLSDTDMPRIRLSSLEPWDLDPDFFALWEDRRLCRHLHLPLQSGCDDTLRRMRRNTSQRQFRALARAARSAISELRLTTDVIVGFPGETDEEYDQSERFISELNFGGLHVFRYSSRPGTPASRMRNQIAEGVKKTRSARLLRLSEEMERRFAESLRGCESDVLWEQIKGATPEGYIFIGHSDNYMRVRTVHKRDLTNVITRTQLGLYTEGEIHGTLKETSPQQDARLR